jgi:hypothetical protein
MYHMALLYSSDSPYNTLIPFPIYLNISQSRGIFHQNTILRVLMSCDSRGDELLDYSISLEEYLRSKRFCRH